MKKVLVIEDNEDNLKLITFILNKNGFVTLESRTGKQGIVMAATGKPDFILLDIQLPDMDGTQVLQQIRKSPANGDIPIIAVTSYAMSGDRERLLAAGCSGYIEKPIDPLSIIAEILHIIEGVS